MSTQDFRHLINLLTESTEQLTEAWAASILKNAPYGQLLKDKLFRRNERHILNDEEFIEVPVEDLVLYIDKWNVKIIIIGSQGCAYSRNGGAFVFNNKSHDKTGLTRLRDPYLTVNQLTKYISSDVGDIQKVYISKSGEHDSPSQSRIVDRSNRRGRDRSYNALENLSTKLYPIVSKYIQQAINYGKIECNNALKDQDFDKLALYTKRLNRLDRLIAAMHGKDSSNISPDFEILVERVSEEAFREIYQRDPMWSSTNNELWKFMFAAAKSNSREYFAIIRNFKKYTFSPPKQLQKINESNNLLLEDQLGRLLSKEVGGDQLMAMLRSFRILYNNTEFEEVPYSTLLDDDFFKQPMQAIVIGTTGSAVIRPGRDSGFIKYFVRGYEKKAKLNPEYFTANQPGQMLHFIGNIKNCYLIRNPRPHTPELERRRLNRASEYKDEEALMKLIFNRVRPILTPIIKKSFLEVQRLYKRAIEDSDYQTAEMYSSAASKANTLLAILSKEELTALPGHDGGINRSREFSNLVRTAFTDMYKKQPPYDLTGGPDDTIEDAEVTKLYSQFLNNAADNTGKEVKYIIDRFREYCLTG